MNVTLVETQILQNIKNLPADALLEILDFVKFIRIRKLKKSSDNLTTELSNLDKSEAEHLEEEFKNYRTIS